MQEGDKGAGSLPGPCGWHELGDTPAATQAQLTPVTPTAAVPEDCLNHHPQGAQASPGRAEQGLIYTSFGLCSHGMSIPVHTTHSLQDTECTRSCEFAHLQSQGHRCRALAASCRHTATAGELRECPAPAPAVQAQSTAPTSARHILHAPVSLSPAPRLVGWLRCHISRTELLRDPVCSGELSALSGDVLLLQGKPGLGENSLLAMGITHGAKQLGAAAAHMQAAPELWGMAVGTLGFVSGDLDFAPCCSFPPGCWCC